MVHTKAQQVPVSGHIPKHLQQQSDIGSSGELLIELVAAVCELNVDIKLHQTAHLHHTGSMSNKARNERQSTPFRVRTGSCVVETQTAILAGVLATAFFC